MNNKITIENMTETYTTILDENNDINKLSCI